MFVTIGSRDLTFLESASRWESLTATFKEDMAYFLSIFVKIFGIMAWFLSQDIPKGLPDDQLTSLQVSGVSMDILRFLVRTLAAVD